ncbi:MAG: hypothetical protein ACK559_16960, partial [bacterium]
MQQLMEKLDNQYISQSGKDIMYRNKTNVIFCLLHMKNALCVLSEYAKLIIYLRSLIKIKIPRNGQTPSQVSVPLTGIATTS